MHVETVRFYQRKGLLRVPDRPAGKIRRYGAADVARIRFIRSAQRLGFSLDEIAQQASEIAERRLADGKAKLADLQQMEAVLSELVERCRTAQGRLRCPLIASLQAKK